MLNINAPEDVKETAEIDTATESSTETETATENVETKETTPTEEPKTVPYERFKEVNERVKVISSLETKIAELEGRLKPAPEVNPQAEQVRQQLKDLGFVSRDDVAKELKQREEDSRVEQELSRLEKDWNGQNGKPKFDRKEVIRYCLENGIGNPEVGFKAMKEQDLINFHVQQAIAKSKGVKTEASDGSGSTQVGVTNDDLKEAAMKGDRTALRTLIKRQVFGTK